MGVSGGSGLATAPRRQLTRVADWLPRGGALDTAAWSARHRGVCLLLWLHVPALVGIDLLRGESWAHAAGQTAAVALLALAAQVTALGPRLRSAAATLGLLTCSAVLVLLFDGAIEAHFHFFVTVAVVALYQAWLPFLVALAFVLLHHGVVGTLFPHDVYNHAGAFARPWLWGAVHAGFILAQSCACLIYWHAGEASMIRERQARATAERANDDLAKAQEVAAMGSWEWDVRTGEIAWSAQLYDLIGVDRTQFVPAVTSFLDKVHPEDRDRVAELIETSAATGSRLDYECRIVVAGDVRCIHALGDTLVQDGVVVHMRGTVQDVTERQRLQEAITQMAYHDPLTGLANRRLFLGRLEEALARQQPGRPGCAVLFLDLDGFKAVNDQHGHAVGDALLGEIGLRLRSAVRENDVVARFGGDEFAVLCEGGGPEAATRTARRIERELERPILVDGERLVVAASTGIAVADPGTTADALLRRADAAMYEVKAAGRPARLPPPPVTLPGRAGLEATTRGQ